MERKLFFTLEFGFKTAYAKLIGFASSVSYEASEGLIYLVADIAPENLELIPERVKVIAREGHRHLLSVPRWGPFTQIVPELVAQGAKIIEISGNKK